LVFIDESGFLLQPLRRRVWAERGHTPVQHAWDRHDRITAMAALCRAPWASRLGLYYDLLDHNTRTGDVVRFLRYVHDHLRRPLLLICDRLSAHRSAVRHLLETDCAWLRVEWLPGYAPDLDPVESLWNQSKYGDLANCLPNDILELHETLDQLLREYRDDPGRLHSFFDAAQLTV
jgi:DDE superfamily endonuclease